MIIYIFKFYVHFKCTKLASIISRNLLYLNVFPAPNRCVWCGAFRAIINSDYLIKKAGASMAISADAILTVNGNGEGGRLEAKRKGGRPER